MFPSKIKNGKNETIPDLRINSLMGLKQNTRLSLDAFYFVDRGYVKFYLVLFQFLIQGCGFEAQYSSCFSLVPVCFVERMDDKPEFDSGKKFLKAYFSVLTKILNKKVVWISLRFI